MKVCIFVCLIVFPCLHCAASAGISSDSRMLIMFWNLENFFDWTDGGSSDSDREFSSAGERRWTRRRFHTKCNAVAKSILWIADRYGKLPDVIGLAEVENSSVVRSLVYSDVLKKCDYGYIHYDSPDPRGIDVALIYRKDIFSHASSRPYGIKGFSEDSQALLKTRDILYSSLNSKEDGAEYHFIVVHFPSKYGGEKESFHKRKAAVNTLKGICDSLYSRGAWRMAVMGDFNDTPESEVFSVLDGVLSNKAVELSIEGKGTIKYNGKWEMIDMFMVPECMEESTHMMVCPIPFLMTEDSKAPGKRPLRTYTGPAYRGGVSDHIPVLLWLERVR